MTKITVKSLIGEEVREIDLPEEVFDYPYKEHLIHTAVRAYQAAKRSGTHSTKSRSEVKGSGRKLWRQKGTGRARVGDRRNPLWRKGGVVHGPRPRSHALGLSVQEKKNALKSALSRKFAESQLLVVDSFGLESHKTAALQRQLSRLGVEQRALLVDSRSNENLELAARNNSRLKTVDALAVNVYDVIDREQLIFSEPALETLMEILMK